MTKKTKWNSVTWKKTPYYLRDNLPNGSIVVSSKKHHKHKIKFLTQEQYLKKISNGSIKIYKSVDSSISTAVRPAPLNKVEYKVSEQQQHLNEGIEMTPRPVGYGICNDR